METVNQVLTAVRRIIRAVDLNSKRLYKEWGLTAPQLLLLSAIKQEPQLTIKQISNKMSLSQGTVTVILDKLQAKKYIVRQRSTKDKRKIHIAMTEDGKALITQIPSPLQESFHDKFAALKDWEQHQILSSLQQLAELMDASSLEASPVLEVGSLDSKQPAEQ